MLYSSTEDLPHKPSSLVAQLKVGITKFIYICSQ